MKTKYGWSQYMYMVIEKQTFCDYPKEGSSFRSVFVVVNSVFENLEVCKDLGYNFEMQE